MKTLQAILLIAFGVSLVPAQVVTGSISGRVVDDSGNPKSGAKVNCRRLREFSRERNGRLVAISQSLSRVVTTTAGGAFSISNLPAGRYFVCASPASANEVGDCADNGVTVVELAAGGSLNGLIRTVRAGTIIAIRVSDPNGRIALPDVHGRVTIERRFFAGVKSPSGFYRPAVLASSGATEYVFSVTVPRQVPVRLSLDTALQVNDESGQRIAIAGPGGASIAPAGRDRMEVKLAVD